MLIDSVIELANISVISKDGQEMNHSQWLALPQGWGAAKLVPGHTVVTGLCMCIYSSGPGRAGMLR